MHDQKHRGDQISLEAAGKILLTIPAYNESARLPSFLSELLEQIRRSGQSNLMIQVVDDGSEASEADKLRQLIDNARLQNAHLMLPLLAIVRNVGKGGAILAGWRSVSGANAYAFVDADGAVPPSEVIRLLKLLSETRDKTLFASRIRMLGKTVERSLLRHLTGRIFATLVSLTLKCGIYDSQCGFKIVCRSDWEAIREKLSGHRFAFDIELLAHLQREQRAIVEVPVDWHDVKGSKVSLLRDGVKMIGALYKIKKSQKLPTLADNARTEI